MKVRLTIYSCRNAAVFCNSKEIHAFGSIRREIDKHRKCLNFEESLFFKFKQ
jgi:hypothetical protein